MKKTINDKEYNVVNKENHPQPVQQHITWKDFSTFIPKDETNKVTIWEQRVDQKALVISEVAEERIPDWILNQLK